MILLYFALVHLNFLVMVVAVAFFFTRKGNEMQIKVLRFISSILFLLSGYQIAELHIPNILLQAGTDASAQISLFFAINTYLLYPVLVSKLYNKHLTYILEHYSIGLIFILLYAIISGFGYEFKAFNIRSLWSNNFEVTHLFSFCIFLLSFSFPLYMLFYSLKLKIKRHLIHYLLIIQFLPITVLGLFISGESASYYFLTMSHLGNFVLVAWLILNYSPNMELTTTEIEEFEEEVLVIDQNVDLLIWNRIEKHIITHKAWKNPNLSLESLASKLRISRSKLSQLINTYGGQNFQNYIAMYRIEAFIEEYKKKPNKKIEYIFEDVGFKSKSAAYYQFKRIKKVSPVSYFKQNENCD